MVAERITVEALVCLPNQLVMMVGLAWLAEGAEVVPDAEHDTFAWWPAELDSWPAEADEPLRALATCCAGAVITFNRLESVSIFHSFVYLALLIVAFGLGNPQPETFVLGLSHGLLWIGMSLVCLWAVRMRVLPLRIAVAVAVLGGIGPFFGSAEFIREQRRRARPAA